MFNNYNMKLYPIWSNNSVVPMPYLEIKKQDWENLGLNHLKGEEKRKISRNIKAIKTGEFREPKKGEWYLSGAIVEAYRAPNDYPKNSKYHIAKLVLTETVTKTATKIVNK